MENKSVDDIVRQVPTRMYDRFMAAHGSADPGCLGMVAWLGSALTAAYGLVGMVPEHPIRGLATFAGGAIVCGLINERYR